MDAQAGYGSLSSEELQAGLAREVTTYDSRPVTQLLEDTVALYTRCVLSALRMGSQAA